MRCTNCFSRGHNRRSHRCPLAENNRVVLFVITYFLFARRIRFGQQIVQVRLPQLFHHAIVLNGQEFGYGRQGITDTQAGLFYGRRGRWRRIRFGQQIVQVRLPQIFHHALVLDGREFGYGRREITEVEAGSFYGRRGRWRVNSYIALPAQFQLGTTLRQMRNIVEEQAIVQRFGRNSYCCIHNNCVSFTQELTAAILRHHHQQMPANLPLILQQYPVHIIEQFIRAVNKQLRNPIPIDHNDPRHKCIFISYSSLPLFLDPAARWLSAKKSTNSTGMEAEEELAKIRRAFGQLQFCVECAGEILDGIGGEEK